MPKYLTAMDFETSYINENPCPHLVVPMPGDGSCLFHSLSFAMFGNIDSSFDIRHAVVQYVVAHWNTMELYMCDERGDTYSNADLYSTAMSKNTTYGSLSEITAAASLYPFIFEIYENSRLIGTFGDGPGKLVKRLRFSGNFLQGHYEVLLPYDNSSKVFPNDQKNNSSKCNSLLVQNNQKKRGRPKKVKKCNSSQFIRAEQIKAASARYRKKKKKEEEAAAPVAITRKNEILHLQLKNLENLTKALTNKIKDRLVAERLIKWAVRRRQQAIGNFTKTINKLNEKLEISLEKLSACPTDSTVHDKLEAFLGKSEHRSNQEPQSL